MEKKIIIDEDATPTEDMDPQPTQPSMTSSPLNTTNSTSDIITNTATDGDTNIVISELPPSPSTAGFNYTESKS